MTESKDVGINDTLAQALLDHTPRALYLRAVRAEAAYERAHQQCNAALNEAARLRQGRDEARCWAKSVSKSAMTLANQRDEARAEVARLRQRADALEQTLREIHALIPDKNDPDYDGHRASLELVLGGIEDVCARAALNDQPAAGDHPAKHVEKD